MLTYKLEKYKGLSLYEALYTSIRDDIISGRIADGEKLPSKRSLAAHLNISITTIENAYAQLMLEGYVHSEPGRGFFANNIGRAETAAHLMYPDAQAKIPYIPPEKPEPKYVVDFKTNQSSLSLFPFSIWSKLMRDTLSAQDRELLKTVPYNGIYSLRKAIADHLFSFRGMSVNPDQIIIGAGTEYLYSRLMNIFGDDSIIGIEDPGYKKFAYITGSQGILWNYIPIDESGMRIDRLRNSKCNIIHISPANHFPTGTVMPISRRNELLEWAYESSSRFIIEDDYDSELRYSGKMIPPIYTIDDRSKVIYINTFSKSLVPSIRISYMVLPPALIKIYRERLNFYSCTVSSFEQITLAKFISEGYFERHINRLKQHYRLKRDLLIAAIKSSRIADIAKIEEAEAGTHFLLRMNTLLTNSEIKEAAEEKGIHLALLSDYEKNGTLKNIRTLVINYAGMDPDQVQLAVQILEDIFCCE